MFVPMHIYVCAYVHACMPVSVRMHARARARVCVCVCVCVQERERERSGGEGGGKSCVHVCGYQFMSTE